MQGTKLELLHYKNAIFQGYITSLRKEGEAIVIFDNKSTLIGKFANDQLNDQCIIFLTSDTYFIGSFKKGLLDGSFVIRSPSYNIYSQTNLNKVEGEILVINKKQRKGRVWQIQNGQGTCIRQGDYDQYFTQEKIVRAIAPYTQLFPSLLQYFLLNIGNRFNIKTGVNNGKMGVSLQVKAARKVTVQIERQKIVASGVMIEGAIHGLGYVNDKNQDLQLEGEMEKSQLHGQGIKREISTNRSIYGKFSRGDIRSLDILTDKTQSADVSLNKLKKRIHIHSLEYTNDYINERAIYLLRNFYESVVNNQQNFSIFQRQKSKGMSREKSIIALSRDLSTDELLYNLKQYNLINTALRHKRQQ